MLEDAALGTAVPLTTNLPFMSGSPSLSNQNSSSSMNFLKTIYNYCFEYNTAVTTRRLLFTSTHIRAGFIPPSGIKSPDIVWELVHLEPLERGSELQENQLLPEDTSLSVWVLINQASMVISASYLVSAGCISNSTPALRSLVICSTRKSNSSIYNMGPV